jgi:hypothetical protein
LKGVESGCKKGCGKAKEVYKTLRTPHQLKKKVRWRGGTQELEFNKKKKEEEEDHKE